MFAIKSNNIKESLFNVLFRNENIQATEELKNAHPEEFAAVFSESIQTIMPRISLAMTRWCFKEFPDQCREISAHLPQFISNEYFDERWYLPSEVLHFWLQQNPESIVDLLRMEQYAIIFKAARYGKFQLVDEYLQMLPSDAAEILTSQNQIIFQGVAYSDQFDLIEQWLRAYPEIAPILLAHNNFYTVRNTAANGHLELLQYMLSFVDAKQVVAAKDYDLFFCVVCEHPAICRFLLDFAAEQVQAMVCSQNFKAFQICSAELLLIMCGILESNPEALQHAVTTVVIEAVRCSELDKLKIVKEHYSEAVRVAMNSKELSCVLDSTKIEVWEWLTFYYQPEIKALFPDGMSVLYQTLKLKKEIRKAEFLKEHYNDVLSKSGIHRITSRLLQFLMTHLNEQSDFKTVRQIAEQAIGEGLVKSVDEKEYWLHSSLMELCQLKDMTIKTKTLLLQAIELVMLSRRVSNLGKLNIFSRKLSANANHIWLMNGVRLLLSQLYPSLTIVFLLADQNDLLQEIEHISQTIKESGAIWAVVGYSNRYHLSLLRLQLNKNELEIQVLDSLGAIPASGEDLYYSRALAKLINTLKHNINSDSFKVVTCPQVRQKDGRSCFSFVLHDLETAEHYLSQGISHFFSMEAEVWDDHKLLFQSAFLPEFYSISQIAYPGAKLESRLSLLRNHYGSSKALDRSIHSLSSLVTSKMITFAPEHHIEEGTSEEDEIINTCSIM